jgi:hypothetical protein
MAACLPSNPRHHHFLVSRIYVGFQPITQQRSYRECVKLLRLTGSAAEEKALLYQQSGRSWSNFALYSSRYLPTACPPCKFTQTYGRSGNTYLMRNEILTGLHHLPQVSLAATGGLANHNIKRSFSPSMIHNSSGRMRSRRLAPDPQSPAPMVIRVLRTHPPPSVPVK